MNANHAKPTVAEGEGVAVAEGVAEGVAVAVAVAVAVMIAKFDEDSIA
jgi:hypothetical protein